MKKINDKATRIIMNNGNSMEVKYKSELLEQIRQDFEIMENESSDIDPGFSLRMTYGLCMSSF